MHGTCHDIRMQPRQTGFCPCSQMSVPNRTRTRAASVSLCTFRMRFDALPQPQWPPPPIQLLSNINMHIHVIKSCSLSQQASMHQPHAGNPPCRHWDAAAGGVSHHHCQGCSPYCWNSRALAARERACCVVLAVIHLRTGLLDAHWAVRPLHCP